MSRPRDQSAAASDGPRPLVPVIIGTAGHIDHGKSALIRALTGTDPDRLKEEKARGITIELGFAFLNDRVAFIDVPGHERFVKHMVAGAATVDYAMLVVAADDGVMPQTLEHLHILDLLGVTGGMVVITKADLSEDDLIELIADDVREVVSGTVLEGAEILVVDSLSGRGIEEVRQAVLALAATKRVRGGEGLLRMPVDRVFTMKGFGTVVTGSILSGTVGVDDRLNVLPDETPVRVRGVQSQGRKVERAVAGQRAAVNLVGVSVEELDRGDVLATPGALSATERLLARVSILEDSPTALEDRQRVHVHLGTADLLARVFVLEDEAIAPGEEGYVELRLEKPTAAQRHDRFIVRRYSPLVTIGGGIVLDAMPGSRRRGRAALRAAAEGLDSTDDGALVIQAVEKSPFGPVAELAVDLREDEESLGGAINELVERGDLLAFETGKGRRYCAASFFNRVLEMAQGELASFHEKNPLRAGMGSGELASRIGRVFPKGGVKNAPAMSLARAVALGALKAPSPETLALADFDVQLSKRQRAWLDAIETAMVDGALAPPSPEELAESLDVPMKELRVLVTWLMDVGKLQRLDAKLYFTPAAVANARRIAAELLERQGKATAAEIRDAWKSSRKYAIPLMEHFDGKGWTIRDGDHRTAGSGLLDGLDS